MYLAKIKYEKTTEDGSLKKVTESYLLDTLSFTETEARITDEMKPFISGEFEVMAIQKKRYAEIVENVRSGFEKWFECKLNFITLNEMGDEKKTTVLILIQSDTTSNANADLITHMKSSMADYTIEAVKETKII